MRWTLPLLLAFTCFAEELTVDLRNPTYKDGILYTNEGGVIQNEDIRIQARTIQYIRRQEEGIDVHKLEAEGDLVIQYKDRAYVGSELEYDFIKKSGMIYEGKTFASLWFVGGDVIELKPDGSYKVQNAFITTCENKDSTWDFHAGRVSMAKQGLFEAKKVRFRMFKVPLLWLPSLKLNLKKFKEPFFRYNVNWNKGPLVGVRYQLYSWRDFAFYGRLEYRWKTGWGGALETEYFPPNSEMSLVTRNYVGTNRLDNAPDKLFRYRLQGAYNNTSKTGKTKTTLTWDKYSDVRMPNDFKSEDFEVNTAKKTILYIHHYEPSALGYFKVRPRFNLFESIRQDLPTLYSTLLPREIGHTGVYSSTWFKASYLDFAYSDQLAASIPDFHAARLEVREKLYRPIALGPATLTPQLGLIGIFYNNSPSHDTQPLGVLSYGARLNARAQRTFSQYKHVIEPYLDYSALTHPTVPPDKHYIFSIQDGYQNINQIQIGVRNLLFSKRRPNKEASFTADLFANAFFSDPTLPRFIPRLYLWLAWRLPSVHFTFQNAWNFWHQTLDYSNARFLWTISQNAALTLEARYRSRYDWRKADHENFILDVTRSEEELLLSPLSDRRITLLTHLFVRLTPFWEWHFQSHHGFYRLDEKPYNEFKTDLFTYVSSACKIRFTLTYVEKDHRLIPSFGINLIK